MSDPTLPSDPARELWLLWRRGPRPDLRRLLDRAGDLTPARVAAALRVDQHERWRIGERVPAADYLRDFPALRGDPEAALELIYGEFLLREELGEAPTPGEYQRAYPEYAERLGMQFEVHRALGAVTGPDPEASTPGPSAARLPTVPGGAPGRRRRARPGQARRGTRSWRSWAAAAWGSSIGPTTATAASSWR